jgi:hypothetical protein
MHDVEVTTTQHYARWLAERWDITAETHANVSDHWLTREDVTADIAEQLRARTAEGQKMFDVVSWVLEQRGTASVTGSEIAETAGAGLLDAFPDRLAAERPQPAASAARVRKSAEITVVQAMTRSPPTCGQDASAIDRGGLRARRQRQSVPARVGRTRKPNSSDRGAGEPSQSCRGNGTTDCG